MFSIQQLCCMERLKSLFWALRAACYVLLLLCCCYDKARQQCVAKTLYLPCGIKAGGKLVGGRGAATCRAKLIALGCT